jgi:glucose-1-phosphate thymidylyltransferase
VILAADAVIENCILGPHVSVGAGARLKNAIIRDAIINENAIVEDLLIEASVVGENAVVRGAFKRLNVGDSSEVNIT